MGENLSVAGWYRAEMTLNLVAFAGFAAATITSWGYIAGLPAGVAGLAMSAKWRQPGSTASKMSRVQRQDLIVAGVAEVVAALVATVVNPLGG